MKITGKISLTEAEQAIHEENTLVDVTLGMGQYLTQAELDALDILLGIMKVDTQVHETEPLTGPQKPFFRKGNKELPLEHEAHAENFLVAELEGRCRLSTVTRLAEEKRLAKRGKTRKPYKRTAKGRYHHKSKLKSKLGRYARDWEKRPYSKLTALRRLKVSREDWDRLIAPIWDSSCRLKGGKTIYTLQVVKDGKVVYDGYSQAVHDSMDPSLKKMG